MAKRRASVSTKRVLAVIMGGGQGKRLFPLTKERAKPAVPLAGKYRLVDIPISNCINSDLKRIYILTQFNSASLHRHVFQSYKFDPFSDGFVEILAAQQTYESTGWYQGTADAVRQNLRFFLRGDYDHILILSGDQLYRMDFRLILSQHIETGADITISTIPVDRSSAKSLGILKTDEKRCIIRFVEKPGDEEVLDELNMPPSLKSEFDLPPSEDRFLASMGIYVFNTDVLEQALRGDKEDFGKNVIPDSIDNFRVYAYIYKGYWKDIGTIGSFFQCNLELTSKEPRFSFFDVENPIYTHPRFLPALKAEDCQVGQAILSDGCIISHCKIDRSIVGVRSIIGAGSQIKETVIMGADFYETEEEKHRNLNKGIPPIGIGENCHIERTIIDKNAHVGDNVRISPYGKEPYLDGDNYYIRDGVVVIAKNTIIPAGTVI